MSLKVGDIISFKRKFTTEDVELFRKVSGDTIKCEVTIEKYEKTENNRTATFLCTNQNEKLVLRGSVAGVILSIDRRKGTQR